ncbi:MAG: hypothetical protein HYX73_03510 [Acidobacteria bacterium]|nr:hypothetical protein [Acidobacteriota bacterium]
MKKVVFGVMILLAGFGMELARAADIALLDSSVNTAEFFERRYGPNGACADEGTFLGRNEYERYFRGWEYVLNGQQLNDEFNALIGGADLDEAAPSFESEYDLIEDSDVTPEGLAGYKVLILSNTASLSAEQSGVIHEWVRKGGKLIATFGSGYKDIIENPHDPNEADPLKSQKGATGGLHQLWHDPWTKAFGTQSLTKPDGTHYGIDVKILKNVGPTYLPEWFLQPTLSYGAEANLLVPRPEHFREALAFLTFDLDMSALGRLYPAILLVRVSKGEVVYFAYAPEFVAALAFDLAGHCEDDINYPTGNIALGYDPGDIPNGFSVTDRVKPQLQIMQRTIEYMLTGN